MPDQRSAAVRAAVKRELLATPGVAAAAGAGAYRLRLLDSPGLALTRGQIQSAERRDDQLRPGMRLGQKTISGTYNAEHTIGGVTDLFLSSIMRNEWTPPLVITEATAGLTSITTTVNTIVASAGSWITAGVKEGDVVTLTDHVTAANNNKRLRVTSVTALTLTLAGTPLEVNAVADAAFTLTVAKKITNPALPIRSSYTVEQYEEDIDYGDLFLGVRVLGMAFQFRPNSVIGLTYNLQGMDHEIVEPASAPYFTDPDETVGQPLVADDSAIRFNGADVAKFTSMDLNLSIAAENLQVIGSLTTPDVYDGDLSIDATIAMVRSDFSKVTMFNAETEFELSGLFLEPGSDPQEMFGFYIPRAKFTTLDAPFLGGNTAKIETLGVSILPQPETTTKDRTAITFFSTGA